MQENKPKIAIVVCVWPPQGGGIGNNAYYHAKLLFERGYEVMAFTPHYVNREVKPEPFLKQLKMTLGHGLAGLLLGLWRELKSFDVVHLYYPFFGTDLIIYLWALLNPNRQLIIHYHMDAIGSDWKQWLFKFHTRFFLPLIVRRANKIIILSEDHARHSYLARYFKNSPQKFVVVPNGIDTTIFKLQEKNLALQQRLQLNPTDLVLLFVGGLDSQHYFKGLDQLLTVTSRLQSKFSNLKLVIIGDGDRRQQFEAQAQQLGITNRTSFLGWVKNDELPAYYNLADIFVLPSTAGTESFGIVTAEAQACGVPAVVSNWPGSRETISAETGMLVIPGDVADLQMALDQLLANPLGRKQMGEAAIARAQRYDWQLVIAQLEKMYRELS
ncbi:MAG: glycosyltransferase family 4 protein [Candidatus Buchananbacteria bacterium]|nr:glycosyltransferase family 4 protein [Candidatus Buchananbacteria bacterium]